MEDLPMSGVNDERDVEVSRLLAGAAKAIASVRYCWLLTEAEMGGASARPMGRVLADPDNNHWTIRLVTDGRSRKACDIRRADKVGLIFQHDPDAAFVALTGRAALLERASEVRRFWKAAYDVYFPSEADRANAAFVEVNVERMELWIRGVTPEPFGLHPTVLERDAGGTWRLSDRNAG
jgi:general stress protein 26